jgi:uncharacterized delta-60 repeat protein
LRPVLVLALVAVASLAEAGVGDMDPSYGVNGRFEARRYGEYFVLPSLADGRVLYPADGGYRRTDANGLPDTTFGVGGVQPWPEGYAATGTGGWARTRDGRLLVALHRQDPNGTAHAVMRLALDGAPDPAFGASGLVTIDVPPNGTRSAQSLLVQLDGKLLLLLARHHPDDSYSLIDPLLIRLMPDGRLDPDFGSGGIVDITLGFHEHIDAMDGLGLSLLADGRIVVWTSPATYLEESGAPASAPPAGAELWSVAALLPDGGAIAWADTSAGPMIAKVREDGSFDGAFGTRGDGTVSPDLGAQAYFTGVSVSGDGRHIYASWGAGSSGGPLVSRFFASGPMAGRLDASFGQQGIVALKSGHVRGAIQGLVDGSAIVTTAYFAYRLLGRGDPSPGYTGRSDDGPWSWLEGRDVELRVFRAAGSNGAIRLRFWTLATVELPEGATSPATPGEDFDAVSGVLEWSDGDDADKVIRIPLRRDNANEGTEQIYVGFEALTPGSWNVTPVVAVAVGDATAASSAGNPPTQAGSSSGGGALGWPGLLLMVAAIAGRLRRSRPHAKSRTMQARILQAFAWLPLVGAAAAQAAPGDVDPGFYYPMPAVPLPDSTNAVRLPDGWLVVQSPTAESPFDWSNLVLTRTDADGRIDTGFGSMGRLTVDLPGDLKVAMAARRLADGSVLLGGLRPLSSGDGSVGAVVRLDPQGRLDTGFGEQGVATIDVQGQLDRVGAIESLPDGRIALLLWSRLLYNNYDCSEDQTALVMLDADGRNPRVESAQARNSFGTVSCRNQMTLQLQSDGTPLYGNELGIFQGGTPLLPSNWRYGPFVLDTQLGSFFTTASGASINVQRLGVDRPAENRDYEDLGAAAGLCGPVTWTRFVADAARQRLYLGLESDGGQVAIARFLVDGSLDTGWGGNGIVAIKGGQCDNRWTTLEGLASDLRLLSVEPDGDVIVATGAGTFQRLAGGTGTAHGAFAVRAPGNVGEGNYTLTITVRRLGGMTGAVSVNYRVRDCDDSAAELKCSVTSGVGNARPDEDFVAASGRLDWSDGDTTDRFIEVRLLDDHLAELTESFYLALSDPGGGAGLLSRIARIDIAASDQPAPTSSSPPASQPPPASKEGGGSGSIGPGLLALLLLAAAARAPLRRRAASAARSTARTGP